MLIARCQNNPPEACGHGDGSSGHAQVKEGQKCTGEVGASQDRWEWNRFIGLQAGGKWKQVLLSSYLTEGWNKKYQNDWDWIGFCAYRPYYKLCSRSEECLWEADQLPVVDSVSGMIYSPVKEVNILNNKWRRQTKRNGKKGRKQGATKFSGLLRIHKGTWGSHTKIDPSSSLCREVFSQCFFMWFHRRNLFALFPSQYSWSLFSFDSLNQSIVRGSISSRLLKARGSLTYCPWNRCKCIYLGFCRGRQIPSILEGCSWSREWEWQGVEILRGICRL